MLFHLHTFQFSSITLNWTALNLDATAAAKICPHKPPWENPLHETNGAYYAVEKVFQGNVPEWVVSSGRISPECCHASKQLFGCLSAGSLVFSCLEFFIEGSLCFLLFQHVWFKRTKLFMVVSMYWNNFKLENLPLFTAIWMDMCALHIARNLLLAKTSHLLLHFKSLK